MTRSLRSLLLPAVVAFAVLIASNPALAQDHGDGGEGMGWKGLVGLGAGLCAGLAALGSGMGQGRLAGSALEGMARNPQAGGFIRTSMMIALAFPESLVLFCFAIAFLLWTKI